MLGKQLRVIKYAFLIETNFGSVKNWSMVIFDRTFFWKVILPDGTVEVGPTYKSYWEK
jgi:hypothetical protein